MNEPFRIRLNCIDHYQATPIHDLDPAVPHGLSIEHGKERPRVSVIRAFGATPTGQKALVHIHGAFQYTYIEYSGSLVPEDVNLAIKTLWLSIDHALAVSYRKDIYAGKHHYVAHISLVKGVPFYGYHVGYKFYLKIYILNPLHMTRLADLLREGAVMKRVLQPYESHMQYIAQWMCDYNLYGCAYMDCATVRFRGPLPRHEDLHNPSHVWHDKSVPPDLISDEFVLPKQSHCTLEVDVRVEDILNSRNVHERPLHHDFIERKWPLPIDEKLVQSMAGLWKDETRRRKARMGLQDPNSSPFPPEVLITMSVDPRHNKAGGWIHEQEYKEKIEEIATDEFERSDGKSVKFDTYVKPVSRESKVQTAFDSVMDLYAENLHRSIAEHGDLVANGVSTQAVVDLGRLRNVTEDEDNSVSKDLPFAPTGPSDSDKSDIADQMAEPLSDSVDSESTLKTPVSSADFEAYGVRQSEEWSRVNDDAFVVPEEHLEERPMSPKLKPKPQKRVRDGAEPSFKPRKKVRVLVNEDHLLPDVSYEDRLRETPNSTDRPAEVSSIGDEKQRALTSQGSTNPDPGVPTIRSSGQKALSFTVVKDPQNPHTIARLSQQSTPSQKLADPHLDPNKSFSALNRTPLKSAEIARTPISAASDKTVQSPNSVPISLRGLSSSTESTWQIYQVRPPSAKTVEVTMSKEGLPNVIYRDAYYSNEEDVPELPRHYAGREFKLESDTVPFLPDFDATGASAATFGRKPAIMIDRASEEKVDNQRRRRCTITHWEIGDRPPSRLQVMSWVKQQRLESSSSIKIPHRKAGLSQIEGPTQKNKHGFKYSQKQASTSVQHETGYMSLMALEVHVNTRGTLAPNPEIDEVACVFYSVQTDDDELEDEIGEDRNIVGLVAVDDGTDIAKRIAKTVAVDVESEATELDLLTKMVDIVRYYDPDILTGYEVHNSSWGFLIERARVKYDMNLCDEISRMKSQSHGRFGKDEDRWGFNHTSTIRVTGRHTINIWRAMRGELNLLQYTMENVVFHLLHQRIPHYTFADLTKWYKSKKPRDLTKVVEYFCSRVQIDLDILDANELVPRTSEQARLIGVDWFAVISRGSQFKVENLMFRIAKPENLLLVSPSRRQVGGQNALECLPLVMEPQSDFYTSPLLVLDFQSLYPSVMIAYNLCYSTFLGRIVSWRGTNKMGFSSYQRQDRMVELLKDYVNIAPNGIMYVKPEIRKSLLAKMLSEILETRVMVKSGMKVDKDDKTLQRLLNNRQLALKLIANVTYGYTSASFSGRMPCSEIADSIVQTGRETLEKAIAMIHSVPRWGAEVVYGDTDSLFVYLKGKTRTQAFDIGEEIAKTITDMNPRPVKLKFEKVYHPCVLLAKKRYVGFKYEHRDQVEPDFDAKGIETVRRDGTPAEQKIEENALKILFRTADLSQVKSYFQAQCTKVMKGKVSIQDFCFAKEVKLGTYSDKGPPPPGALISARRMLEDPRLEPQYGERVPYVVITGGPGARLIDRCVAPDVLLNDAQTELDAEYYISKNIIPPLERIFNLVGAHVRQWYDEMPKYQRIRRIEAGLITEGKEAGLSKKTLESYMKASTCIVCREGLDSESPICQNCFEHAPESLLHLRARLLREERSSAQLTEICRSCSSFTWNDEIRCDSKDCPVFYSRVRHKANLASEKGQVLPVIKMLEDKQLDGLDW